jgi:hypothetical protein
MRVRLLKKILILLFHLLLIRSSIAQIKLGNTATQLEKSALLELNGNKQGFLLPRLTDTTVINSLNPPDGMMIYFMPATTGKGLYIRKTGFWQRMTTDSVLSANLNSWSLTGNNGLTGTEKLGSINNTGFSLITNNTARITITNAGVTSILGNTVLGGTLAFSSLLALNTADTSYLTINNTTNVVTKRNLSSLPFIQNLNGLTAPTQFFSTTNTAGTFGFTINAGTSTHILNIPDATVSTSGFINAIAQTFGGNKTFSNNIIVSGTTTLSPTANIVDTSFLMIHNLTGLVSKRNLTTMPFLQNLNGLTATTQTFAITTNAAAIAFSTSGGNTHNLNIPDADASNRGVVNTGTQTFAGNKAFTNNISVTGTTKIGTLGSALTTIIRDSVNYTFSGNLPGNSATTGTGGFLKITLTYTNAKVGASVTITPSTALPNNCSIAYSRVGTAGQIEVMFLNTNSITVGVIPILGLTITDAAAISSASMPTKYYLTLIN